MRTYRSVSKHASREGTTVLVCAPECSEQNLLAHVDAALGAGRRVAIGFVGRVPTWATHVLGQLTSRTPARDLWLVETTGSGWRHVDADAVVIALTGTAAYSNDGARLGSPGSHRRNPPARQTPSTAVATCTA